MNPLFNPHLKASNLYIGGKSRTELSTDKKIYKLSSNENLLGSSPEALKAIRKHIDNLHEYPDNSDIRLRAALSTFYKNEIDESQFITAMSGSEVLEFIIRAFLVEGAEYIVCNPMFKPYQMFSDKLGAKMVDIPLIEPDFSLDVEGILSNINKKTRLIFLTSPNNPTGTYIPKKELDKIVQALPSHTVLVLDEVYYHYADAADYTTIQSYVAQGKQVIGLNSFSKTYGLAGLRIGYAYTTPLLAEYVRRIYKPFHVNTLALEAGIAALGDFDFLKRTVSLVQTERLRLYKAFDELGIIYWKSQANFILFDPKMDEKEFESKILQEGIMVRPAGGFGVPNKIRVTIGTEEANIAFIQGLKNVMS